MFSLLAYKYTHSTFQRGKFVKLFRFYIIDFQLQPACYQLDTAFISYSILTNFFIYIIAYTSELPVNYGWRKRRWMSKVSVAVRRKRFIFLESPIIFLFSVGEIFIKYFVSDMQKFHSLFSKLGKWWGKEFCLS